MKKIVALALAAMLLVCGLAACKAPTTDGATKDLIGIVLPTKEETYWLNCQKYLENELTGYNYEILYSQGSSATEKTNVETFINKDAKYLVICPFDADAAASTVEDAKKAGLTVICYDRLITNTEAVDYYVTFDSKEVGRAQARYLVEQANGKKGINLYMYAGALTDNNSLLFFMGVWEVLQPAIADGTFTVRNCDRAIELKDKADLTRDEYVSIMQIIDTEWSMPHCKELAEAHLSAVDNDAKGDVFVLGPPDDDCARALYDAFTDDADVTSIVITGADGNPNSFEYIIQGKQSMTVYKDTVNLAKGVRAIVEALVAGKKPETNSEYDNGKKAVPSMQYGVVTVTKENIGDVFFKSGLFNGADYGWTE